MFDWLTAHPYLAAIFLVWSLVWKGFALWRAAELQHKRWFVAILIINTFGILEMIYLYFIARKYKVEVIQG